MESHHGFVMLLGALFPLLALPSEGAPTPDSETGESIAEGYVSLSLPLAVSLSALIAIVVLLLNCVTCCKEREINFKEFEDNFEDEIDFTPPAEDTPSMQSPAEVYTLAVPPVALPGPPHLQLPHMADSSAGSHVPRHTLSYIQEIGNGWFGKVLLSEIYSEPGAARVVVKELKASASSKEQNEFLQQGDPYRVLQHPNILHCLGQCVEAIPFLLVFEYCELGDLKSYVAQQDWLYRNTELLQLQKMACEIAAGVTHLHKHNFLHSDLALRNCYLTSDMTIKVGDYGIGPSRFKDDYITTEEDKWVPLRWLAPELVGELHGGVITAEQTKPSNVWALGVTLWELFEKATQPYSHLSDREVLNHVIRDQQIKLFKPQLDLPYSERWYEVLQFCWLPPDKRATAEEVHRLLTYLRMQGQKEMEDDFEQRWNSLKPNPTARQATVSHSSFPILEQFDDGREPDEVLTVTESSRGLSFEYVWEAAKHDHYDNHNRSPMDTTLNYHSMFFPVPRQDTATRFTESVGQRQADSGNFSTGVPGILPVFDAHKAASGNEYYIQLEEQEESDLGGMESQGAEGSTTSEKQQFVVLEDIRLDESSTDADFFHRSIDSKDSFLQDSHVWSSSEHESPYHTNIFSEGDSKLEDSHSWRQSFMELPKLKRDDFQKSESLNGEIKSPERSESGSFLGEHQEAIHLGEESPDVMRLLNTEKLTDNFMFLKENNLMKEDPDFLGTEFSNIPEQQNSTLNPFSDEVSEMVNVTEGTLNSEEDPVQLKEDFLNLVDPILDFLSPKGNETLVPSDIFSTGETCSNQLPVRNGSSNKECIQLHSSEAGIDSIPESTSESAEGRVVSSTNSHQSSVLLDSATTNILCTDAKTPSLEDSLGSSKDNEQYMTNVENQKSLETSLTLESKVVFDNSLTESPTIKISVSDMLSDSEKDRTLDEIQPPDDPDQKESPVDSTVSQDRSSLLISDPCPDQISQDSLLEDSLSSTLPTIENSAETPDSLDSLDIHRDVDQVETLDTPALHKLQPPYKTADSGYETENLESPEWNSQPSIKDASPENDETNASKVPDAVVLVPPEIIVSEADPHENVDEDDHQQGLAEDVPAGGSYRDSAYFSDNEEPEKRSEDISNGHISDTSPWPNADGSRANGDVFALPEVHNELTESGAQMETSGISEVIPDLDRGTSEGNGLQEFVLTTEEKQSKDKPLSTDGSKDEKLEESLETSATSAKPSTDSKVHAKLTRMYAGEGPKRKEPDMEGRYLGKLDGTVVEDGPEDGMDADEEDENSDDSDEDMRAYRLHSDSSESEDDTVHPVPVIVSDNSDACNLKSLLKPKSLQTAKASPTGGSDGENSKRGVSFFDDVTVYLFDQETPTKELGDHSLGSNSQVSEFSSPVPSSSYLNRFTNSESSTDEEGGAFEWDDDFPSEPSFLSKAGSDTSVNRTPPSSASRYFSPPPANRTHEQSWTSTSSYSRFSISPASIASFSLTHLTDSDIDQGGSSEDGEKD
ncbi:serine/threonine-protein kinase LMTK2 isoform X2 [Chanos chanos]|uniref:Serine/threonine-protein kinase LMTK2 n=1 Tax=Chanos chanos TaxID=29144 RepID=A0A6J2WMI5_CHACN|nr:serine/threonine-protein kinase LMTK2 isoform X2 [Chanos chanos]